MSLIKNLYYKEGSFVLDIKELEISDTGITSIQGPSGSGKTTFFNILTGILPLSGWSWSFKGEDLAQLPVAERRLGVVFQSYELFPHLTAEDNVKIVAAARHQKKAAIVAGSAGHQGSGNASLDREALSNRIEKFKSALQLERCWKTKANNLSGGEKQRVAFLRAVISNPRLLLLDEPFSALDEKLRMESRETLKGFLKEVGVPVLLVTHDAADVAALADHHLYLRDSRIVTE